MSTLSFESILEFAIKMLPLDTLAKSLLKYLTDKDDEYVNEFVDYIFDKVNELASENIPGYKKSEKVREQVKSVFNEVADWAINLVIELAVAKIKAQND